MPTHVAFLRAINLGANRKFPKDAIKAACEEAGCADVETYINTGNVRVTTRMRSRAKVEAALEEAFLADRGFEVPTIVFSPAELVAVAEQADELWAGYGEPAAHYITLLKRAAPRRRRGGRVRRARRRAVPGPRPGRPRPAAEVLPRDKDERQGRSTALGVGTSRNVTVVRELARRWGPGADP